MLYLLLDEFEYGLLLHLSISLGYLNKNEGSKR